MLDLESASPPPPASTSDAGAATGIIPPLSEQYADNTEFNAWLDNQYPAVSVGDYTYLASEVLFKCDLDAYRTDRYAAFVEDLQETFRRQLAETVRRHEEKKQIVIEKYPHPIAYHFHRMENEDDPNRKLARLINLWDVTTSFLFALVVSEYRVAGLPFPQIPRRNGNLADPDFFTEKPADKLTMLEYFYREADTRNHDLACRRLASSQPVADFLTHLQTMRGLRNLLAHSEIPSSHDAITTFQESYRVVLEVLFKLDGLEQVELFRYHKTNVPSPPSVRGEYMCGKDTNFNIRNLPITYEQLATYNALFNEHGLDRYGDRVLVKYGQRIFSLAPFFHFDLPPGQESPRIHYFKQERRNDQTSAREYIYGIVGGGIQEERLASLLEFHAEISELDNLKPSRQAQAQSRTTTRSSSASQSQPPTGSTN